MKNVIFSSTDEVASIKKEAEPIEELCRQMFLELVDMHEHYDRVKFSETIFGKYLHIQGLFLCLLCTYKIFTSNW